MDGDILFELLFWALTIGFFTLGVIFAQIDRK